MARQGRPRRPGGRRRLQEDVMRGARADRPAASAGAARAARSTRSTTAPPPWRRSFMVLLLVDGAALGRSPAARTSTSPGIDAYAGYMMAGAGFLALAHTLKRGEHIRVTLLLSALHGRGRRALRDLGAVRGLAAGGAVRVLQLQAGLAVARLPRHLDRQRRDAALDAAADDGARHRRAGDRLRRRAGARAARQRACVATSVRDGGTAQ